ncbi:hypothetical protein C7212DRAFT_325887 [Tuber magnatum]|uniref:Uncharacterized protein n=1 Tax=Tuber magnatum TaxID=42249 RepID=A0A317SL07_9PEZI|nr:hypothetical protein C7212DRAFT_325887 [Tuber magnatum]
MNIARYSTTDQQSAVNGQSPRTSPSTIARPFRMREMPTTHERGHLPTYSTLPVPLTPHSTEPRDVVESDQLEAFRLHKHLLALQKFQYLMTLADKLLTAKQWDEMMEAMDRYAWKTDLTALWFKMRIVVDFLNYDLQMLWDWKEWTEEEDKEGRVISERGCAVGYFSVRGGGFER